MENVHSGSTTGWSFKVGMWWFFGCFSCNTYYIVEFEPHVRVTLATCYAGHTRATPSYFSKRLYDTLTRTPHSTATTAVEQGHTRNKNPSPHYEYPLSKSIKAGILKPSKTNPNNTRNFIERNPAALVVASFFSFCGDVLSIFGAATLCNTATTTTQQRAVATQQCSKSVT